MDIGFLTVRVALIVVLLMEKKALFKIIVLICACVCRGQKQLFWRVLWPTVTLLQTQGPVVSVQV